MIDQQLQILHYKKYLEEIRSRSINDNKAGLTDSAKLFEGVVAKLYNIYYDTDDFEGFLKQNNPAIDLKSDKKHIAASVKARDNAQTKLQVEEIVKLFKKHYAHLAGYRLILQEICDEPKTKISVNGIEIRYFGDLCNLFNDDFDKLSKVSDFIKSDETQLAQKAELNEVATIIILLEYLSDDANYKEYADEYECDPQKKLESKLKDFAPIFKADFERLLPDYYFALEEARKAFGNDGVRARKISNHLIYMSNRFLDEASNNATIAFNKLYDHFVGKVTTNKAKCDGPAIQYFLLEELIGCNIFSIKIEN
jgi:hypothetical protein